MFVYWVDLVWLEIVFVSGEYFVGYFLGVLYCSMVQFIIDIGILFDEVGGFGVVEFGYVLLYQDLVVVVGFSVDFDCWNGKFVGDLGG